MERDRRACFRAAGAAVCLVTLGAVLLIGGCSEDDSPTDASVPDEPFVIEDTVGVDLDLPANGAYRAPGDSVSFRFPEGASGRLVHGALIGAPPRGWEGGRGLYIRYEGGEEVRLSVPFEEGSVCFLLCYGSTFGSWDDPQRTRWFALPVVDTVRAGAVDSLMFRLGQPDVAAGKSGETGVAHWLLTLPAGSTEAGAFHDAAALAGDFLAAWLDSLDEPLRAGCGERRRAFPPAFYPDGWHYTGFSRPGPSGGAQPLARIGFDPRSVSPQRIAHQVGHYCMHLLAGDQAFLELEEHAPVETAIGAFQQGRRGIVEDYARLHEWILTGSIGGAGHPGIPAEFFGARKPDAARIDVPSIEGYGVVLLHALARADTTITNLRGESVTIPIVGFDYGELAARVLVHAPADMSSLWNVIGEALAESGREDLLPPLAAATGWAYTVRGTLLDAGDAPVAGARIWSFVEAGGRYYRTTQGAQVTDSLGEFTLTGIASGNARIRVDAPADSFDFEVRFLPTAYTDAQRDLKEFTAWPAMERMTRVMIFLDFDFAPTPADTAGGLGFLFANANTLVAPGVAFEADRVRIDHPYVLPWPLAASDTLRWTVDSLDLAYSRETGEVTRFALAFHNRLEPPQTLALRAAGPLQAFMEGCNTVHLVRMNGLAPAAVAALFEIEFDDPGTGTHSETDLRGNVQSIEVRLSRG